MLTDLFVILFPGLRIVRLASGRRLWRLALGRGGGRGWRGAWHRARGLLVVVGVVGGPGGIGVGSRSSSFACRGQGELSGSSKAQGPAGRCGGPPPPLWFSPAVLSPYLGREELVAAIGGRCFPSPGVGTGEGEAPRHCRTGEGESEQG